MIIFLNYFFSMLHCENPNMLITIALYVYLYFSCIMRWFYLMCLVYFNIFIMDSGVLIFSAFLIFKNEFTILNILNVCT